MAEEPKRGHWGTNMEFILSCIGYSVGLGNIWRFPFQVYCYGGAAFLFAYLILQFLIGKPMYFMELTLGQYSARGPTGVWTINPCCRGIGIAMLIISLDISIYYNVIVTYILYYLFMSFRSTLPWTKCDPEWTQCVEDAHLIKKMRPCAPGMTDACICNSVFNTSNCRLPLPPVFHSPAESFFTQQVINQAPTIDPETFGAPLWHLVLCLVVAWIAVILCLIKGVESLGKVVYFTSTFPYVVLLVLLVIGALQEGAGEGVKYFIVPDWKQLGSLEVWTQAAGQVFFSLGLTMGGIIMLGSYNNFRNNVFRDSMIIAVADLFTSVMAGFVIFTNLGGLAHRKGVRVQDVADSGFALAFIVYPEALSHIPPPQLWSVIFFLMFFCLGLDSEFALIQTLLTCMADEWPNLRRHKTAIVVALCCVLFFIELPMLCPGGLYVTTMFDHYGADISLLIVGVFEVVSVAWVYGLKRFRKDIEFMLGISPRPWFYWASSWAFFSPIGILILLLYRVAFYHPPKMMYGVPFPAWAQAIGFCLMMLTISPVPIWFIYSFYKAKGGLRERLRQMTDPCDWVPAENEDRVPRMPGKTVYSLNEEGERVEGNTRPSMPSRV